jgi:membrane protein
VPLFTVALAVFTAFPMFGKLQDVLQRWLVESLVPDNIARQVLGYLTQFAGKASRWAAGVALLVSPRWR